LYTATGTTRFAVWRECLFEYSNGGDTNAMTNEIQWMLSKDGKKLVVEIDIAYVVSSLVGKTEEEMAKTLSEKIAKRDEVRLTRREKEVLAGILNGEPNKEIAMKLNLSERTVKFHASSIYAKTHASGRGEVMYRLGHGELRVA
jgi:DNA-binding NarL/FixJ family response regulator